jgi:hypothetical protein
MRPRHCTTLTIAFVLGACAADPPPPDSAADSARVAADSTRVAPAVMPAVELVDPGIPPAVAGQEGWNYQQSARTDLTGDGQLERVVITARVELYRGRPAWDDGQPWQVYVEAHDGTRTYVYARRLQLGTLAMRLSSGAAGRPATIVLLEHRPDRLAVYEASYEGPGRVSATTGFERALDPRGEAASPRLPE